MKTKRQRRIEALERIEHRETNPVPPHQDKRIEAQFTNGGTIRTRKEDPDEKDIFMSKLDHNARLLFKTFVEEFKKRRLLVSVKLFDAPAADAWIVIVDDEQAWVAVGGSDDDEFVFWGPLGHKCISFPIPDGWRI